MAYGIMDNRRPPCYWSESNAFKLRAPLGIKSSPMTEWLDNKERRVGYFFVWRGGGEASSPSYSYTVTRMFELVVLVQFYFDAELLVHRYSNIRACFVGAILF